MATRALSCGAIRFALTLRSGARTCYDTFKNTSAFASGHISSRRRFCSGVANFADKKYSKQHEWVSVKDNEGTVGISDYAQDSLGEIVFVELPDEGTVLSIDDQCGAVESVKAATELYTPLSGTVCALNSDVQEKPSLINSNPEDDGWLFKLTLSKPEELDRLMSEKQYKQFLVDEHGYEQD